MRLTRNHANRSTRDYIYMYIVYMSIFFVSGWLASYEAAQCYVYTPSTILSDLMYTSN